MVGIGFLAGEVTTRLFVAPATWMFPKRREEILTPWMRFNRKVLMGILGAGRTRFRIQPRIPNRGGILLVMNHQSLLDIPAAFVCVPDGYPIMVSRDRYGRGIPMVSLVLNLYRHILVRPGRMGRADLDALAETARGAAHPILIFPEGHRTRDGEIRPWKRGGLDVFLSAREWTVHVLVIDGLWKTARIPDFVRTIATVACRLELAGTFEYDGRGRMSHDEFIDRIHLAMCDKLAAMRREGREPATKSESSGEGAVTAT